MRESFNSLYVGFPLAMLGIFIIIATIFRSYAQPFVIMFTIPFGIIGAIMGHMLFGYDLSIMSVFGMVALAGVVVNDAIVLIERINENLAEGMRFFDAVLNGGTRRFRAIFLTTLSTVGGLAPLIMETDLQARFLIPMALALAAGVTFATLLTLVLIPSLLAILNDLRLLAYRFRYGVWPKREKVEPARTRYEIPADDADPKPEPTVSVRKQVGHFTVLLIAVASVLILSPSFAIAEEENLPATEDASNIPESDMIKREATENDLSGMEVLDLETAQRIALRDNPSLAAARQRVLQAKERIRQARAAYWPRLDAMASGSRVQLSENAEQDAAFTGAGTGNVGTAFSRENPEDYYRADMTLSWDLFDGFERKFLTAAAKHGHQESRFSRLDAKRLLLSAVATTYYNALLARENIRIAEADEEFNRRQLEDARARRRVGTGSLSDVLNFQVQINSARSNLIAAKNSHEQTLHALAALMGVSEAVFAPGLKLAPLAVETAQELELPQHAPLIDHAQNHRPDLIASRFEVKRTEKNLGASKSGYYPKIQLSATLDGDRDNSARFEKDDFGNTLGVNLTYNLFAGGLTRARVGEARYRLAEAKKSYQDNLITVKSEVRTALSGLDSARQQLILQRSNADLVRQNRDLVEKEYNAGQISLVRLNEAQRDLTEAESRLALALVSLRQAWKDLKTATGQILQPFSPADQEQF